VKTAISSLTGKGLWDNVCFRSTGLRLSLYAVESPKMFRFVRLLSLLLLAGSLVLRAGLAQAQTSVCPTPTNANVTTWHNDNCRTGWQQNESILTPSALTGGSFGLLWQYPIGDDIDAQPLAVSGLGRIAGCTGSSCSLVFIADEQDNLYAFDAASTAQIQIWKTNVAQQVLGTYVDCSTQLGPSFPPCEVNTPPSNHVGIMGTPVIDAANNLLYAVVQSASTKTRRPRSTCLPSISSAAT
jgi:hypothetical protein